MVTRGLVASGATPSAGFLPLDGSGPAPSTDPTVAQRRQRVVDSACKNPWNVGSYNPSSQFSAATYPHILKARNYALSQFKDLYPFVYKNIPASVYNKEPWPQTTQIENLIKAELALAPTKIRGSVDVLLGDSLSYYFPVELYPQGRTLWNIGIPGNTTNAVLARLNQVRWSSVDRVFMLIGINDYVSQRFLGNGSTESTAAIAARVVDGALDRTKQIMETIYKNKPNASIYVISLFPSRDKNSPTPKSHIHISNAGVIEHNKRLKELARSMGAGWINSALKLSEPTVFAMKDAFTYDGIHLSWTGNINYAASLQEGLRSICTTKQPVSP